MQPTEPRHGHEAEAEPEDIGWLTAGGRGVSRLAALLLWVFVGSYSRYHPVGIAPYTVGLVGGAIGVALLASLVGTASDTASNRPLPSEWSLLGVRHLVSSRKRSRSRYDRLLQVGCMVGILTGTVGILSSVDAISGSQPVVSEPALIGGVVLVGSLVVLVDRWAGRLAAGLAVGGLAVGWLTLSASSAVETLVFNPTGIYGPLTRAAAVWVAPACLLGGLWQSTRTAGWLRESLPTVRRAESGSSQQAGRATEQWPAGRQLSRGLWQVTPPSMGWTAFLIAWLSVGVSYRTVIAVAAVPAAVCWLGLFVTSRSARIPIRLSGGPTVDRAAWRGPLVMAGRSAVKRGAWFGPLVMAGGPLALMAVLLVGARLPLGTVLLAGCLLAIGLATAGPMVGLKGDGDETDEPRFRTGFGTVLDGSVVGIQLFARVAVILGVAGGVVSLLQAGGVSTWLLSSLLWVSGGQPVLAGATLVACCVLVGMALPMLAGYGVGALLIVPLFGMLTGAAELTAHLLVCYAVVGGWLIGSGAKRWIR